MLALNEALAANRKPADPEVAPTATTTRGLDLIHRPRQQRHHAGLSVVLLVVVVGALPSPPSIECATVG